jgi:hypothetical protein
MSCPLCSYPIHSYSLQCNSGRNNNNDEEGLHTFTPPASVLLYRIILLSRSLSLCWCIKVSNNSISVTMKKPSGTTSAKSVQDECNNKPATIKRKKLQTGVFIASERGARYRPLTNFKATFSTFLNEDEGKDVYNSAITFQVVPIEFRNNYLSVVKPQNVDFVCLPTLPCLFLA